MNALQIVTLHAQQANIKMMESTFPPDKEFLEYMYRTLSRQCGETYLVLDSMRDRLFELYAMAYRATK